MIPTKVILSIACCVAILSSSTNAIGQKIAPYKYGEVDTVRQYVDAQIISYKLKNGKQARDTIWVAKQKKDIVIDWSHVVETWDTYLRPRIITSATKNKKSK